MIWTCPTFATTINATNKNSGWQGDLFWTRYRFVALIFVCTSSKLEYFYGTKVNCGFSTFFGLQNNAFQGYY